MSSQDNDVQGKSVKVMGQEALLGLFLVIIAVAAGIIASGLTDNFYVGLLTAIGIAVAIFFTGLLIWLAALPIRKSRRNR